ncbi:MAG TPA: galactokinase [Gaiellaceae bacterium]|nr:galactokinase [Gaiellaceae bacterium]
MFPRFVRQVRLRAVPGAVPKIASVERRGRRGAASRSSRPWLSLRAQDEREPQRTFRKRSEAARPSGSPTRTRSRRAKTAARYGRAIDRIRTFRAPGRVNLIGEYTDLAGGLVLPAALELGVTIEARRGDTIRLTSRERPGDVNVAADGSPVGAAPSGWGRYVAAVAVELDALGRPPVGLDGEVSSTLPIGTGLSSSAALEVAVAVALAAVSEWEVQPLELAQAAQRAELRAVGVPCGIMDQAASLLGRAGHLLLLDTRLLEYEHVPFPERLALVIVDSAVSRRLEHSAYGERRAELETALTALDGRPLDDADPDALALDPVQARRLRHVVTDHARVRETVALLRDPTDASLARLGDVFRAGQQSLRDDLDVTVPEMDLLVDLAYEHGALAARMTGGGFGGSIVALAAADEAQRVAAATRAAYEERTGRRAASVVSRPAAGAGEVP